MEIRGGASISLVNASWPMAVLKADMNRLELNVVILGNYVFYPEQVIAIEKYSSIMGSGVRIRHNVPEYPAQILFSASGGVDKVITQIAETGFKPSAPPESELKRSAMPVQWVAVIAIAALWARLCYLAGEQNSGQNPVNWRHIIPLASMFISALATSISPVVQSWVMKPGRSVNEIRPWLNLLMLVASLVALIMLVSIQTAGPR